MLDKYLKIQKEQSEIRQRLGVIGLMPEAEVTTEVRAEQLTLRQRAPAVEAELQAAFRSSSGPSRRKGISLTDSTRKTRELRALTASANIGEVISAASEQRMATGATAELQKHYGINSESDSD